MKSMTGYGKYSVSRENRELTVELKSVNHRFLDVSTKIPRMFLSLEDVIRNAISNGLSRGHVDVYINYTRSEEIGKRASLDISLAGEYVKAARSLSETFPDLQRDFNVTALLKSPEVLTLEQPEDDEDVLREMLETAVNGAVAELNAMREREGNALRIDLLGKLDNVEKLLNNVKFYAPQVVAQYRDKLLARITEALQNVPLDEGRLANEVCFFADKSCIDEEITRLTSHIARARELLASDESVGRKLDFLIQEFNRETNTICSKSSFLDLTSTALEMKNEIEKIREQIQNLE